MNKTWKWILGILLVLVVVAGMVCAHSFLNGTMRAGMIERGMFQSNGWDEFGPHGQMMGGEYGCAGPGNMMGGGYGFVEPGNMMGGGYGFDERGSMMRGHGFFPFFGRLIPLALLGLLVYGAYRFGVKKSNPQVNAVVAPSEVAAEPIVSETMGAKSCLKCGGMVQEDWRNCPYCGTKQ